MNDSDKPDLGAYRYELIELEAHEQDKRYWEQLRQIQMPTQAAEQSFKFLKPQGPRQPPRPQELLLILRSWANALFYLEASKYPPLDPRLPHWLTKLAERVEDKIIVGVKDLESVDRPFPMRSLSYHGLTESDMRRALSEFLPNLVSKFSREHQRQPETMPPEQATQSAPLTSKQELGAKPRPADNEIERRKALLAEYKAATGNPSNRKIYESKNSGLHKPQFYEWINGQLPPESATARNFERFLMAKKPPIPRKPTN